MIVCTINRLSRILILSTYYEKIDVQKAKINNVKNLFVRKKCDLKDKENSGTYTISKKTVVNQREVLTTNTTLNQVTTTANQENEAITLQDDSLDLRSKEYANCSHQEDTPICVLKKSMLKNQIQHDEIEIFTNYNYEKELDDLDNYFIPDLIVIKQELLILLYLINESKPNFIRYFKRIDLDILISIYFENLSTSLNVDFDTLDRNHQNLITSQFNMRCLLIYLQNIEIDNSSIIDLTRNVLKKATSLGSSYEIHCFITELALYYIESLFKEIDDGELNILEYDFLECDKYLQKPILSNSPIKQQRFNLRPRIRPNAPKKVCNYKMEEIKDYIQEMYDLDCQQQQQIPKKNSVKLNFTDSDEEECDQAKEKENLKMKINKLKSKKIDANSQSETEKLDNRNEMKSSNSRAVKKQLTSTLKEVKKKTNLLFKTNSKDLDDLNDLNNRIGKLGLDDTFEDEDKAYVYLIDETSNNYYIEFRKLLHKILDLFPNYPSIKHYNSIYNMLFRLSICSKSTFGDEAAYYFSEICQANALRYVTVQHLEKKRKYIPIKNDSKVLEFNNKIECKNEELKKMFNVLPSNWRVVQIQFLKGINSQTDLYLARYQRDVEPILLKINVNSEKVPFLFLFF